MPHRVARNFVPVSVQHPVHERFIVIFLMVAEQRERLIIFLFSALEIEKSQK
jgi:hypothetical protein